MKAKISLLLSMMLILGTGCATDRTNTPPAPQLESERNVYEVEIPEHYLHISELDTHPNLIRPYPGPLPVGGPRGLEVPDNTKVTVVLLISEHGEVDDVLVAYSDFRRLEEHTVLQMGKAHFDPGIKNGEFVPCHVRIHVQFHRTPSRPAKPRFFHFWR